VPNIYIWRIDRVIWKVRVLYNTLAPCCDSDSHLQKLSNRTSVLHTKFLGMFIIHLHTKFYALIPMVQYLSQNSELN
jgi:hypothetical protein